MRYAAELGKRSGERPSRTFQNQASSTARSRVRAGHIAEFNLLWPVRDRSVIDKAKKQLDRLYESLSSRGIALSIRVYPWPQQLLYDVEKFAASAHLARLVRRQMQKIFDHFPIFRL
jgi:hypothetical protein